MTIQRWCIAIALENTMGAIREKMKADLDLRRFAETTKKE
jgi:hypothetical protein